MNWYYNTHIKIPKEWDIIQFEKILSKIQNGFSYKYDPEISEKNGLPITRIETISKEKINPKKVGYVEKNSEKRCKTMLQDDILFSHINSLKHVGKTAIYENDPPILIHGMNLLRIIPKSNVNARYLSYFLKLKQTRNRIKSLSQHAINQVSINTEDMKKFLHILVPPIEEQKEIASILKNFDILIQTQQQMIEEVQNLKHGHMQKLLTKGVKHTKFKKTKWLYEQEIEIPEEWSVKKIDDVTELIKSGVSRLLSSEDIGFAVATSGNISEENFTLKDMKYWYKIDTKSVDLNNYILDENDILLNFINSLSQIGKSCIFEKQERDWIYTTNIFRIKSNSKMLQKYLYYVLNANFVKSQINAITQPAVNQASFTKADFEKIKILVPLIKEQEKIVSILSTLDLIIKQEKEFKVKLEKIKLGLMQQLLTGQKRVKV